MAFGRKKRREEIRIELTSMVDVVFLLLIFFMVSTTFLDRGSIGINLPQASDTASVAAPREVRIYLTDRGQLRLDDVALSQAELLERLRHFGRQQPRPAIVLLADRQARHGQVVAIMDAARQAGLTDLAIATQTGDNGTGR
ncbi:ExbD/TolR family protein [Desulfuromonas thiophila]|jgi:biopolymer transport protein ExbD|uniref:Biopolymer transport protein ExbD n=1 Tax=Desulfuromonas thiophila TaxID=57664 RepID=A0A1G7AKW8_9BACT|nr:biopolymer transporter ExbD [Desulfuromonas thiophila]MCK9172570.1 biopolymer transporter ExbD [Desulfuromonas thiophila]MDY0398093.1 biopolymer transporter ExbD [Desulfuromonas thiophila]SDE14526.1 biopolymer transport protein ExbD [Desulfuromonas thiophila]